MRAFLRVLLRSALGAAIAVTLVVLSYAIILGLAWLTDPSRLLSDPAVGTSDFSHLAKARNVQVVVPNRNPKIAVEQLAGLVRQASAQGKKITIAGSRHSMGGHTLLDDSLCVDMRAFRQIEPVAVRNGVQCVRVGAGATWHELLPVLDREGWSVAVMQSNDDFTIGGSISVNCHGWQPHSPPLDSTVESFRILLADGSVRECQRGRAEDRELFAAVCGGYGLLGIVLNADLRVVPNALYRAEEFAAKSSDYAQRYGMLVTHSDAKIGLAYGRLSVAPGRWFLDDARIIRLVDLDPSAGARVAGTIGNDDHRYRPTEAELTLAHYAFRASAMNDFAKWVRWAIERYHGQTHRALSRNAVLQTPSDWFANRDPRYTEILHEYLIPPDRLAAFTNRIRPILRSTGEVNLLNVTVRNVQRDDASLLSYARQEVFGLVMLFRYQAETSADEKMRVVTQELIEAALACDGSYYLPYRPHATITQFHRAYGNFARFQAVKRKYDPDELFQNSFYATYLRSRTGVESARVELSP